MNTSADDGRVVLSLEDQLTTYQVCPAHEYRTLAHHSGEKLGYGSAGIRLDGRLLALGTSGGVVLWDMARGAELALLSIGRAENLLFEASGDLLTSGSIGVRRWPVRLDRDLGEFRIGPPQPVPLPAGFEEIAEDQSGRVVALAGADTAFRSHARARGTCAAARRRPVRCCQPRRGIPGNRQPWQNRRPGLANAATTRVLRIWRSRGSFALRSAPTGDGS